MARSLAAGLEQLEAAKRSHGTVAAEFVEALLKSFREVTFQDASSLIRFHDTVLFLRAYPHSVAVATECDRLLAGLEQQVVRLRRDEAECLEFFDDEEFSGIAGTTIADEHTFEVATWLAKRYPKQVHANWDIEKQYRKLGNALPRFAPLIEEDTLVEPDIPFESWLSSAAGEGGRDVHWLLERFDSLPFSAAVKSELYDALDIELEWDLGNSPASRTLARKPVQELFFHAEPLIQRKQVSLERELTGPDIPLRKLNARDGEKILTKAREALAVRHRELYGTTRGDVRNVYEANVGRGTEIFLWGIPAERRLPLRAYWAGCTFKNGVPINYVEAIGLFEWMEVGFNTFYAFRDGETAWIYSKMIHLFHQVTGVTCISVYPYQIGFENEEAIKSGAFWFYRKLGFRAGDPELQAVVEKEEAAIRKKPSHRTSARVLRRLATRHIFFEFGNGKKGLWDQFSTRRIGLALQRRMAEQFECDPEKMRRTARMVLEQQTGAVLADWNRDESSAFENFAVVLTMVAEVSRWSDAEKRRLVEVIKAKAAGEEREYMRLLQGHDPLRRALLALGSERKETVCARAQVT